MKDAMTLVEDLERHGVTFRIENARCLIKGPTKLLSPGVLAELRRHKPEILKRLAGNHREESTEGRVERAAIMEYEGGPGRDVAESLASESHDHVRGQGDACRLSPKEAASIAMRFSAYIADWTPEVSDDLPAVPPILPPPYRAEVWSMWWDALERRNEKYSRQQRRTAQNGQN